MLVNEINKRIVNSLATEIQKQFDLKETLAICNSQSDLFNEFAKLGQTRIISENLTGLYSGISGETAVGDPFDILDKIEKSFDFIVGDLLLGMNIQTWNYEAENITIRTKKNWLIILKSLLKINENGFGLFLVEPVFGSKKWADFLNILNEHGYFISSVFNPPEKLLAPHTTLQPNLVLISKNQSDQIFLAELDQVENIPNQIENLKNRVSTHSLVEGVFTTTSEFRGFFTHKITDQISKLQTQYKEYKSCKLSDVSIDINLGKQNLQFSKTDNSVYIPRVGNSPVISDLENATIKHQNYIQVVVDNSIIKNKYLELFFSSELGELVRRSLFSGLVIQNINKSDLENVFIPIPPLPEQDQIIETSEKLSRLIKHTHKFQQELSLNPQNSDKIKDKVNELLEQLNLLSDTDKLHSLIRKGESIQLEFKSTLRWNLHTDQKDPNMEYAVLKTIVAFLNSKGGTLIVGVADNGELVGISADHFPDEDKFKLHLTNLINKRIGKEFYSYIN